MGCSSSQNSQTMYATRKLRSRTSIGSYSSLKVSLGRLYRGKEGEFGWARIRLCVAQEEIREAVARFDKFREH
jgi:hypothetical protein